MDENANKRLHSAKYTLDSDEEDEEERQDQQKMNPDELKGSSVDSSVFLFDSSSSFRHRSRKCNDWIR